MAQLTPQPPERRLLSEIDAELVGARLHEIRARLSVAAAAHGHPAPEVLVASKYFTPEAIPALLQAGATLLGENRADVIAAKQAAAAGAPVQWDYIGELQSRKVGQLIPVVARIHTLASDSAVRKLLAAQAQGTALPKLLVQVNVAGEEGKGGVAPAALPALLDLAAGLPITGLMTMPPLANTAEENRPWFATLAELAATHGLRELSMGTSQDALAAAAEGATIVRLGGLLHNTAAWEQFLRDAE